MRFMSQVRIHLQ